MNVCLKSPGWIIPLFLCGAASAMATETDKWYRSPSFLGRGGAGLADPRDEDAIFFNPANLYQAPCGVPRPQVPTPASAQQDLKNAPRQQDPDNADDASDAKDTAPISADPLVKAEPAPPSAEGPSPVALRKVVVLSPLVTASDTLSKYTSVGHDDTKLLQTLRDNVGKPVHAGADNFSGVLFGNFGLGLVTSMYANFYVYRDPNNSGIEAVDLKANENIGLASSYGYGFLADTLMVGGTVKYLKRTTTVADVSIANLDDIQNFSLGKYQNSGMGLGLDLGLIYKLKDPLDTRIGLHVADLGDTHFKRAKSDGIPVDDMLQTIGAGVTIAPPVPVGKSTFSFDLTDIMRREDGDRLKNIHCGADYLWNDLLGFALGVNQGFSTWGAYVTTRLFRMDLGSYGEEVGDYIGERSSRRYYLRLMSSF